MVAQKISMKNLISSAPQAQEIYQLKARVEELEAELSQVRSGSIDLELKDELETRIQELTNHLVSSNGEHEIEIALIDPDPEQPRKSFPQSVIQERAESLKRHSQLTPIIVIPNPSGRYTLFEGELRTKGAMLLGWKTIRAVFLTEELLPAKDEVLERQLVTSIHSTRINDLDLAEAIVSLLLHRHPHLNPERIPRLLQSALYQLDKAKKLSDLERIRIADQDTQQQWLSTLALKDADEKIVLEMLLWLQLNPNSIKAHVFPLLNLQIDLKQTIRQEGLESSKARELSKLSSELLKTDDKQALTIRTQTTQKVVQEKLSVSQTKALVRELLRQNVNDASSSSDPHTTRTIKQIEGISVEAMEASQLKEIRKALQKKLKEIDTLLN